MSEPGKAVFLSYASQDAEAAKRICEALRAVGVEVWFDQSELVGGDAWDQKIRKQIKDCALLIPIVSAATQARTEGYFRLEWRLADQRTHLMARGRPFLLPVVIDNTRDADAQVPDSFTEVQWTRLPGGETTPAFATRVAKLLAGDHDAGRDRRVPPWDATAGSGAPARQPKPRRWLAAVIAAAVLVALAISRPWEKAQPPPVATRIAAADKPVEILSEARQLAARARQLRALDGISRERLGAADDLVNQALKLDPTDAEVWATAAQVDTFMVFRGFDISETRRQSAVSRAARSLALAPASFEARHAQAVVAGFLVRSKEMLADAETDYRALLRERPADPNLNEEFGEVLRREGRHDEAAAAFMRAARPLQAAGAYFDGGRFGDARKIVDEQLAKGRSSDALVLKANVELLGFGDREAAQAALSQLSPTELMDDEALAIALRLAMVQRDAARITSLLEVFPNPFVSILGVSYPRQYWTGMALAMRSQPDAAQAEWRRGLEAVQERLKSNPNDRQTIGWIAEFQSMLGEKDATEQSLRLYRSYSEIGPAEWDWWIGLATLHEGGRNDEVIAMLSGTLHERTNFSRFLYIFARYAAEFDPLRGDPRFEALLRETLPEGMKPLDDPKRPAASTAVDPKSVAVLAFANLSEDKGNEYFSDGISEELLNVLAKVPGLKVTARTSSFYFKDHNAPIADIARQLGVAYLVEGSVRKAGTRVRISAQLIKAADGFQVWSDDFDRELKDVFAVQDEIAGLIARNLQLKLGDSAKIAVVVDPEAYRLYLEGRQALQRRTVESYGHAETLFQQARAIAPEWAPVYAGLADTARLRTWGAEGGPTGPDSPWDADMKNAKALAERALQFDPGLAEAYVALGGIHMIAWQMAEAERNIRHALELNPNSADAYLVLGRIASADGRLDESIAALRRAAELNPLAPRILDNLTAELGFADRVDEAWAVIERATASQPDSSQIQCYRARVLTAAGRRDEALAQAQRLIDNVDPEERDFRLLEASRVYAVFGRQAKAEETIAGMARGTAEAVIACGYVHHPEKARPILHQINFGWIEDLIWGRDFDPIRNDPQFVAYLKGTGLFDAQQRATAWRAAHPGAPVK